MFRVDRKTLQVELEVRLSTAMRTMSAALRSKQPGEREATQRRIVGILLDEIDGSSSCVVRADHKRGFGHEKRGEFGVDEDWPALLDMERHTPPDRNQMKLPLDGI
jgi:hypothetical protein